MKLIIAVLALSALLMAGFVVVYAAATGESCEDRGGVTKFSHFQQFYNGRTMTLMPIYKCEVADERR